MKPGLNGFLRQDGDWFADRDESRVADKGKDSTSITNVLCLFCFMYLSVSGGREAVNAPNPVSITRSTSIVLCLVCVLIFVIQGEIVSTERGSCTRTICRFVV